MAKFNGKNGNWYTDENGKHYFVAEGQTPQEGWEASHRRKMINKGKYQISEDDGKTWKDTDKDSYDKYEAEDYAFDNDDVDSMTEFDSENQSPMNEFSGPDKEGLSYAQLDAMNKDLKPKPGMSEEEYVKYLESTGRSHEGALALRNVFYREPGNNKENKSQDKERPISSQSDYATYNEAEVIGGDDDAVTALKDATPLSEFDSLKQSIQDKNESGAKLAKEIEESDLSEDQKRELRNDLLNRRRKWTEEHNRMIGRQSQMHSLIDNAKSKGQSPQQVLDSVAYDMDIEPGSEEFNTLKDLVMKGTHLNKESGQHEYNRFNIGSNKTLRKPEDREKLNELRIALQDAGLQDVKMEDGYEDYGANMFWTNLTSDGTWVLNPSNWMDYMNGNATKEEIVDRVKNGKYSGAFKWGEPKNAAEDFKLDSGTNEYIDSFAKKNSVNEEDYQKLKKSLTDAFTKILKEQKQPITKGAFKPSQRVEAHNTYGLTHNEKDFNDRINSLRPHLRNNDSAKNKSAHKQLDALLDGFLGDYEEAINNPKLDKAETTKYFDRRMNDIYKQLVGNKMFMDYFKKYNEMKNKGK